MLIIVDSREQLPYWKGSECAKTALIVGDYSTERLINKFHIERKSPQDLYGTITKGNHRFKRELQRAWDREIEIVVYVESTREDFIMKRFPRGDLLKFKSESLDKLITTFETKYFLQIVWCGNRTRAKDMVLKRLKKEHNKIKL